MEWQAAANVKVRDGVLARKPLDHRERRSREFVRTYITHRLQPLLDAQIDNAQGLKHLRMRDLKTGQFTRVTGDAKQIDKALKSKNACWIYTKDPNIAAFTDLLNRAIDKPAEHTKSQVPTEDHSRSAGRLMKNRSFWSPK
jgi:hypothetical protein